MKTYHIRHSKYKFAFFAYVSTFIYVVQGARPVCDVPPADLLEPTTLTCYFQEDFAQSKSGFRVINLSRNVSVVNAIWEDGEHSFSLEDSFSMDGQRSEDRLTFKINQVSRNHTGTYACIPEEYRYQNVGTCTLYLKTERPNEPEFAEALKRNNQDCVRSEDFTAVFAALSAVSVLSLVVVVIVLITCLKTQRRLRDEHNDAYSQAVKNDSEKPLVIKESENFSSRNGGYTLVKLLKPFFARLSEHVSL